MRSVLTTILLTLSLGVFAQLPAVTLNKEYITINLNNGAVLELPINSFLEAQEGDGEVKYKMAAFDFEDKAVRRCQEIEISNLQEGIDGFTLLGRLKGMNCNCNFELFVSTWGDNEAYFNIKVNDPELNRLIFRFKKKSNENFLGFGEQGSYYNLAGHKFPVFCEEQGLGRGDKHITGLTKMAGAAGNEYTSYAPIPFFMTDNNKGMFLENTQYMEYDLSQPEVAEIKVWSRQIDGWVWAGEPKEILEKYTARTGRMPELPDWAYGTWLGLQGGAEKVKKIVDDAIAAGNPVTAVWIQDWVGKRKTRIGSRLWWKWEPDEESYPNIKQFNADMNAKGVKVLGYINSFLADEGPMFEEAKSKGYLVKNKDNVDYEIAAGGFKAYLVDLTNPDAYDWLKNIIIKNLIGNGFSGWMADFGEWLPMDAKLYSGEDPMKYHNRYPVEWAKLNREAIQEAGKEDEIVFFSRSGFGYSNKYSTLFWAGDQMVSWGKNDGLPSAITSMLSSGMSGLTLNHTDIGGYTTVTLPFWKNVRSRELFYRWAEMAVFTPVFRTHEGLKPEKNFQFYDDAEGQEFFAKMGKMHHALKDYFKHLSKEASEKGLPMVRSPFLYDYTPKLLTEQWYSFLLGDDLLVHPVVEKGATKVQGYFPHGEWESVWTGGTINGGDQVLVDAPIGKPAVYVRVGGEWSERIKKALRSVK